MRCPPQPRTGKSMKIRCDIKPICLLKKSWRAQLPTMCPLLFSRLQMFFHSFRKSLKLHNNTKSCLCLRTTWETLVQSSQHLCLTLNESLMRYDVPVTESQQSWGCALRMCSCSRTRRLPDCKGEVRMDQKMPQQLVCVAQVDSAWLSMTQPHKEEVCVKMHNPSDLYECVSLLLLIFLSAACEERCSCVCISIETETELNVEVAFSEQALSYWDNQHKVKVSTNLNAPDDKLPVSPPRPGAEGLRVLMASRSWSNFLLLSFIITINPTCLPDRSRETR